MLGPVAGHTSKQGHSILLLSVVTERFFGSRFENKCSKILDLMCLCTIAINKSSYKPAPRMRERERERERENKQFRVIRVPEGSGSADGGDEGKGAMGRPVSAPQTPAATTADEKPSSPFPRPFGRFVGCVSHRARAEPANQICDRSIARACIHAGVRSRVRA